MRVEEAEEFRWGGFRGLGFMCRGFGVGGGRVLGDFQVGSYRYRSVYLIEA